MLAASLTGCAAEPGTCRLLGCCCCCCCPPSGPVVLHSGSNGNSKGRLEITTRCPTTTNHKFPLKNYDFLARLPFILNHKPQLIPLIDTNIADEGPLYFETILPGIIENIKVSADVLNAYNLVNSFLSDHSQQFCIVIRHSP